MATLKSSATILPNVLNVHLSENFKKTSTSITIFRGCPKHKELQRPNIHNKKTNPSLNK